MGLIPLGEEWCSAGPLAGSPGAGHHRNGDFRRRSLRTHERLFLEPPHFLDHRVERVPGDELHRVEVPAVVLAHAEHRDDVRVMELCRRPGFAAEAFEPGPIGERVCWRRLERDVAAERFLNRLIHRPQSPAPDQAENSVVAHPRRMSGLRVRNTIVTVISPLTGFNSSISTSAGRNSRTSSSRPGSRWANSAMDGRSPARYRARNSSANASSGRGRMSSHSWRDSRTTQGLQ